MIAAYCIGTCRSASVEGVYVFVEGGLHDGHVEIYINPHLGQETPQKPHSQQ